MRTILIILTLFICTPAFAATANIVTSEGTIRINLFQSATPTVAHFVGLATGSLKYTDTKGRKVTGRPFYNGLIVHRSHPTLGFASGCPLGTGRGWAGKSHSDPKNKLPFYKPGLIAMSHVPGEKGYSSQFFITATMPEHLNGKHTVFGEVTDGMDVVKRIAAVSTDFTMKPKKTITIKRIDIDN